MLRNSLATAIAINQTAIVNIPKSRGNPRQIGVHERLVILGYSNPDDFLKEMLKTMIISELANFLGFSLSTMSRYCDKAGIRSIRHHCRQKPHKTDIKEELPPNTHSKSDFFVCACCRARIHVDLRSNHPAFVSHCAKCVKNLCRLRV